jgi:hypothetical protein
MTRRVGGRQRHFGRREEGPEDNGGTLRTPRKRREDTEGSIPSEFESCFQY